MEKDQQDHDASLQPDTSQEAPVHHEKMASKEFRWFSPALRLRALQVVQLAAISGSASLGMAGCASSKPYTPSGHVQFSASVNPSAKASDVTLKANVDLPPIVESKIIGSPSLQISVSQANAEVISGTIQVSEGLSSPGEGALGVGAGASIGMTHSFSRSGSDATLYNFSTYGSVGVSPSIQIPLSEKKESSFSISPYAAMKVAFSPKDAHHSDHWSHGVSLHPAAGISVSLSSSKFEIGAGADFYASYQIHGQWTSPAMGESLYLKFPF